MQISAAHTEEDIDRTVAAFIEVGKSRNVIWVQYFGLDICKGVLKRKLNSTLQNHVEDKISI